MKTFLKLWLKIYLLLALGGLIFSLSQHAFAQGVGQLPWYVSYTVSLGTVATPTFSPVAGSAVSSGATVTVSSSTGGSTLYADQSNPPTTATSTFTVSAPGTWYAQAKKSGWTNSAVGSAAYTIAGPATRTVDIKTSCTGDGADACYTSLATAVSSEAANLVTAAHVLKFVIYTSSESTSGYISTSGYTTNSTYYIDIGPSAGNENKGLDGQGFVFTSTGGSRAFLDYGTNLYVHDIELVCASCDPGVFQAGGANTYDIRIERAYLKGLGGYGLATGAVSGAGATILLRNSIVRADKPIANTTTSNPLAIYAYNDTLVMNGGYIMTQASDLLYIKNTLITGTNGGSGDFLTYSGATVTCDYCAFFDAPTNGGSGGGWYYTGGANNRNSQTFTFESSPPYRIKSTDAGAKGYGTDLSADATWPFSVDITNTTRTDPWDIGAFIYGP